MNALFEIGQKVVCVDSKGRNTRLVEGKTYKIIGIKKLPCCDSVVVDVGIKSTSRYSTCTLCWSQRDCDNYKRQTRFVPIEFDRQADEEIHEALKGNKILN